MDRAEACALPIAIASAIAIAMPARHASAWCQMTSSSRRPDPGECIVAMPPESYPLAWRRRCTSISLSTMGSSTLTFEEVAGVLEGAIATWEAVRCGGQPTGIDIELLADRNECAGASYLTSGGNVSSVVFVADDWVTERMHDPRAFAVTLVWHDPRSGEIWDVDMEINEQRGPYGICPATGCPDDLTDLPNVVTHEIGHYLGLAHTPDDPLATMWASAEPDEVIKRDLAPDDEAGLCAIYPPGALPEECDYTPRGGLNLACVRDEGCGCSAPGARDRSGRAGAALLLASLALASIAVRRARRAR